MNNARALIYVVDDDISVRERAEKFVAVGGFTVQTFSSAQEFLASARPDVPSCLVLDVQLPGLSGLDLQQELAKAVFRFRLFLSPVMGTFRCRCGP